VPTPKVLIIADNADSAGVWEDALRRQGIESRQLRYGVQTQTIALPESDSFALVLIDSYTASDTALLICGLVRAKCDKPILLLTYENDERYQLRAYEAGVGECVVAPVSILLFLAKIRVWLQQVAFAEDVREEVSESGFQLDPRTRQVFMPNGEAVRLSAQEFRLLRLFTANSGRVLESDFLLSQVWSHDTSGEKKLLRDLVYRLRQKLEPNSSLGKHIRHIDNQGYMWDSNELG
jgi:two-component system, OmpR family, response regulator